MHCRPQPDLSGALFFLLLFLKQEKKAGTEGGIAAQIKKRLQINI